MRHRLLFTLGLLILCASLAACGAGSITTATTTPPTPAAPAAPAATVAPTAAASSGAAATTRPAGSATATPVVAIPTTPAPAAATTIAVELKDFAIALNTSTVPAGKVTFTVKNMGPSPHNFNVRVNGEEKGVTTLDPDTTATLTLDLPPGTYAYRCDIPGHDLLGMKGTLTVR